MTVTRNALHPSIHPSNFHLHIHCQTNLDRSHLSSSPPLNQSNPFLSVSLISSAAWPPTRTGISPILSVRSSCQSDSFDDFCQSDLIASVPASQSDVARRTDADKLAHRLRSRMGRLGRSRIFSTSTWYRYSLYKVEEP
jgi:hypothetical protein